MQYALEVAGLCKSYKDFELKDVSFSVPNGSIMGFVGPNGAGKTTTIKSILGLVKHHAGEIRVLGHSSKDGVHDGIGVVSDETLYDDDWHVKDIGTVMKMFCKNWDAGKFERLLKEFSLDRKKRVSELSRGMNVKLMIAAALSKGARLLVLDEPTSGLDPVARDELCDILLDYVAGKEQSVLFSTHISADLERVADFVTFILGGEIVFSQEARSLRREYYMLSCDEAMLDDGQKGLLIGARSHLGNLEGLLRAADLGKMPPEAASQPATLDEIVVSINRGGRGK